MNHSSRTSWTHALLDLSGFTEWQLHSSVHKFTRVCLCSAQPVWIMRDFHRTANALLMAPSFRGQSLTRTRVNAPCGIEHALDMFVVLLSEIRAGCAHQLNE